MSGDLKLLEKAFQLAGERIPEAAAASWSAPTPCSRWTVRELANHVIALPTTLARAAEGERLSPEEFSPDAMAREDFLGGNANGASAREMFVITAQRALTACRVPGALSGSVSMHRGEVPLRILVTLTMSDVAVHSWDMARVAGLDPALPDDLAETALAFMAGFLSPGARTGPHPHFASVVPAPQEASPTERLVAYLGRRP